MSRATGIFIVFVSLLTSSAVVFAQKATPSSPAELTMVTKGVFKLNEGESMDLTDRGILLHFERANGKAGEKVENIWGSINGTGFYEKVGYRWKLKELRSTEEFVKDIRVCVLDNISAVYPQGAPASAVFRLLCE